MKILVVILVQEGKLLGRALQTILRQEWRGQLDFLFLRGGNDTDTSEGYRRGYVEICRKYNEAREIVLRNGYDAMFCAESDMLLPTDALQKLVRVDADVAYGLTVWRHGQTKWSAAREIGETHVIQFSDDPDFARANWGKVVDVQGVGTFCTLIHRRVLEALQFRLTDAPYLCVDWHMSLDCIARGFTQKCDLSVVCGHMTLTPTPRVLWPDVDAEKLYRVELVEPRWTEPQASVEIPVNTFGQTVIPFAVVQT